MIGSGTLTKQLAGHLARTGYQALEDEARRATKDHILYTLGTILAGSSAPGIEQAIAGARFERCQSGKLGTRDRRQASRGFCRFDQCDHGPQPRARYQ